MKTSDKLNAIAMPVYEKKSKAAVKIADQIVKAAYAHARRGEFSLVYKFKKGERKWCDEIVKHLREDHGLDVSPDNDEDSPDFCLETPRSISIYW